MSGLPPLGRIAAVPPEVFQYDAVYGAVCGDGNYRVRLRLQATAMNEPPPWLLFRFADTTDDGLLTREQVAYGATGPLSSLGFKIVAVSIDSITNEELYALEAAARNPAPAPTGNRRERRAAARASR